MWSQARSFWTAVPQAPVAVYVPDKRVQGMENGKEEPSEDNPTDVVKIEASKREIETAVLDPNGENGGQNHDRKRGSIFNSVYEVFNFSSVIVTA